MEFPVEDILNRHMAMGIFALYIVVVSLVRIMAEQEFFRLTALKKIWGRTRGLTIHFVANVAMPLVVGIVFLSHGIVNFSVADNAESDRTVLNALLLERSKGDQKNNDGSEPPDGNLSSTLYSHHEIPPP